MKGVRISFYNFNFSIKNWYITLTLIFPELYYDHYFVIYQQVLCNHRIRYHVVNFDQSKELLETVS